MLSTGFLIDFNLRQLDQASFAEVRGSWLRGNGFRRFEVNFTVDLWVHEFDRVAVEVILEILLVCRSRTFDGIHLEARDSPERASLAKLLVDSLLLLSFT